MPGTVSLYHADNGSLKLREKETVKLYYINVLHLTDTFEIERVPST